MEEVNKRRVANEARGEKKSGGKGKGRIVECSIFSYCDSSGSGKGGREGARQGIRGGCTPPPNYSYC